MKVILSCSLCLALSFAVMAVSDPTKPDVAMAVPVSAEATDTAVVDVSAKFKLGLIKNVQGHYMALINGQSVKRGDEIDGYKVLSINRQQVVLQQANERLTLSLFKAMKTQ
jgi:MSHA biogenesis protein MshK